MSGKTLDLDYLTIRNVVAYQTNNTAVPDGYIPVTSTNGALSWTQMPSSGIDLSGNNYGDYIYWDPSAATPGWVVGSDKVSIGANAGSISQGLYAVAIGTSAGENTQGESAIAIGKQAGFDTQGINSIAIGLSSGYQGQGSSSIAIGPGAALFRQGNAAIAIGSEAADNDQQLGAIAIGRRAGFENQGEYSIAIGFNAADSAQPENTIVLNASGSSFNADASGGFYVNPVRNTASGTNLFYDNTNGEISYQVSSEKYKENIVAFSGSTEVIYSVEPKEYTFKSNQKQYIGYIAEELNELSSWFTWKNPDGTPEGIQWNNLMIFAIEEIKKLRSEVTALKEQVAALTPA